MLDSVYVTVVVLAGLMFSDYVLTLKGFELYKRKYAQYVRIESYELNPVFRDSVDRGSYDLRHIASVIIVCGFVYALHYAGYWMPILEKTYIIAWGMLLSLFLYVNSRHIQNIMIFNAVENKPSLLSGQLKQTREFSLKASNALNTSMFTVLAALFLFNPSYFTLGFALGPLAVTLRQRKWA